MWTAIIQIGHGGFVEYARTNSPHEWTPDNDTSMRVTLPWADPARAETNCNTYSSSTTTTTTTRGAFYSTLQPNVTTMSPLHARHLPFINPHPDTARAETNSTIYSSSSSKRSLLYSSLFNPDQNLHSKVTIMPPYCR